MFFGLAIHGNYIFWSDWARRAVLRTNKFTGGDTKVLRADIPHQPMGIVAVAKDTNNCKCSHNAMVASLTQELIYSSNGQYVIDISEVTF